MAGFKINKQAIRQMTRELEKEFAKNPVRVPIEADASGASLPTGNVTNYNAPVVTVTGDNAQIAWNNRDVSQNQTVAEGYEELARLIALLLENLGSFGLASEDAEDSEASARTVLGEVVAEEPDEGKIRRSLKLLKGIFAPVASGASTAISDESAELARKFIEALPV